MANIRFTGPDGHVFEFEDGTPEHVRRQFIQRHYGTAAEQQRDRRSAAVSLAAPADKRGLGERLGDVFSHTFNTGFIAEGWRAGADDTADYIELSKQGKTKEALDLSSEFSANPARIISRLFYSPMVAVDSITGGHGMRDHADGMVADERARRQEFQRESDADPFYKADGGIVGKTAHGAVALLGTLGGAALDPTSYITGGSSLWARIGVQGMVAGGVDLLAQSDGTDAGTQDNVNIMQTALSVGAGAAFQGAFEGAGALGRNRGAARARLDAEARAEPLNLDQAFRNELDVSDAVNLPALTTDAWTFRPTKQGPTSDIRLSVPERPGAEGPRMDGPEAEARMNTETGTDAKPNADEAWNGVDWGLAGSPERAKAMTSHLDRLKTFIKPESVEQFVRFIGGETVEIGGREGHWNKDIFDFDKLASEPEKFEEMTNVLASVFRPMYDAAGDATQTWKSVAARQELFGISVSDAVKAHADITSGNGAAAKIHALETVAIQHVDHLAKKVTDITVKIRNGTATADDYADVATQLQAATMFDAMAAGAKSEVARALNIMKMTKTRTKVINDVQSAIDGMSDAMGGKGKDADDMLKALEALLAANKKDGAKGFKDTLRKQRAMGISDYVSYYLVMGYLSTPATAMRNAIGSVLHAGLTVGERYVAAGITTPIRRGLGGSRASVEGVTFREANAYVAGIHQSFADASRAGFRAFKTAGTVTDNATSMGEAGFNQPFLMTQARLNKWKAQGPLAIPDMLGTAVFTTLRTLGHRPSLAMDEFSKTMTHRMQLNALAVREASYRSARLRGDEATKEFNRTMDAVANRPTAASHERAKAIFSIAGETYDPAKNYSQDATLRQAADTMASVDLHAMAEDYARMMAFQNSGPALKRWEKALNGHRVIKALYVPFFRTPVNLVRAGMFDRNPVLAPLLKDNREKFGNYFGAMVGLDKSLQRGGAEADMAMARMVTGLGFMATAGFIFANGDLVGKRSAAEEEDGVKSYSIRIGGRWVQYSTLSPVAEMIGIVADMMQTFKDHDINDDDMLQGIGGGVLAAIVNNIVNKAALQGVGDFWDMIDPSFTSGDSDRGARAGKEIAKKVGGSIVPAFVRNLAQTQDPVMREANDFLDYIKMNIPTLSQSLPERRDWLGLPIVRKDKDGGLLEGLVQPLRVSERVSDIVRLEVSALSQTDPELRMAQRPQARFNGQKIEPREHSRVLEIQGQVYRNPVTGENMHEALATLIQSQPYSQMSDVQRAQVLKDTVSKYRRLATAAIKRGQYPDLRPMLDRTGAAEAQEQGQQKGWSDLRVQGKARAYGVTGEALSNVLNFQPGD